MRAGGDADHGMKQFAAIHPAVSETDNQVCRLFDQAVKGQPDPPQRIRIFMGCSSVEQGAILDESVGSDFLVGE